MEVVEEKWKYAQVVEWKWEWHTDHTCNVLSQLGSVGGQG